VYVRLKHTLSALALAAIRQPSRGPYRDAVICLAAFCRLIAPRSTSADAAAQAIAVVTLGIASRQPWAIERRGMSVQGRRSSPRALEWLVQQKLLQRYDDTVALPPEYQPYFDYMQRQVRRLVALLRRLTATPVPKGRPGTLRRGVALFNGGLFFECHEYFEDIWRAAPADERDFYHGLILVAAAFYHYEKGNLHGARVKLSSGIHYLRPLPPASHGIRLDRWLARLEFWSARIEAGLPAGELKVSEIPKIPLARARGHTRRHALRHARRQR
jgi:predicted metal-dependent hydrolase